MGNQMLKQVFMSAVLVVIVIAAGGAASAYWGGTGSGSGSGSTGTTAAMTLTPGIPTTSLYPGGQANVSLTISNPNNASAHIGALLLDTSQGTGGFAVDTGHSACALTTLGFTTQTNGGAGWTVPARIGTANGSLSATLTNALSMGVDAADACQGANLTVYLKVDP